MSESMNDITRATLPDLKISKENTIFFCGNSNSTVINLVSKTETEKITCNFRIIKILVKDAFNRLHGTERA